MATKENVSPLRGAKKAPGPFEYLDIGEIVDAKGRTVAVLTKPDDALGQLLAASWSLCAAAKRVTENCDHVLPMGDGSIKAIRAAGKYLSGCDELRAAIAKADAP